MNPLADLGELGFTEYEAKVYLALLQEHPSTGYQISKRAGIPRSMVYEALGRLDVRGAVLKTEEGKATLYRPMPPDVLLDRLAEEHERRIETLRHPLMSLYTGRDEGHMWTFEGVEPVLSYAQNMIAHAEREAMLVLTDRALEALRPVILQAQGRGVRLGALLTGEATLDIGQVAYHPPRESELHKLAGSLVIVVDEQEVLIADSAPDVTATVTTNANLVQIGRQFVWMELFAHRVFSQLEPEALTHVSPEDRSVLEWVAPTTMRQP